MPTPKRLEGTSTEQPLGRHTRLAIPFRWRDAEGELIDLQGDSFTAEVWVGTEAGTLIAGPRSATVTGTAAEYQMEAGDLAEATSSSEPVTVTCVASQGSTVLPPNKRKIVVADWAGADSFGD